MNTIKLFEIISARDLQELQETVNASLRESSFQPLGPIQIDPNPDAKERYLQTMAVFAPHPGEITRYKDKIVVTQHEPVIRDGLTSTKFTCDPEGFVYIHHLKTDNHPEFKPEMVHAAVRKEFRLKTGDDCEIRTEEQQFEDWDNEGKITDALAALPANKGRSAFSRSEREAMEKELREKGEIS